MPCPPVSKRFLRLAVSRLGRVSVPLLLAAVLVLATSSAAQDSDAASLFARAQDLHEKGELQSAIDMYLKAVELEPGFAEAHFQLAVAYAQTGKPDLAETAFTRAAEARKGWTLPVLELAESRLRRGGYVEAAQLFRSVASSEPESARAWGGLAEAARRAGEYGEARMAAGRALAASKDDPDLLLLAAVIEADTGKRRDAIALLTRIPEPGATAASLLRRLRVADSDDPAFLEGNLRGDSSDLDAVVKLCTILRTVEPARAVRHCRSAMEIEPDEPEHEVRHAAALVQAGRLGDAVASLSNLRTRFPENRTVRANLATALLRQKRWADANPEYLWLTLREPDNTVAFYLLGIVFDELREYDNAMSAYRSFLDRADPAANGLEIEKVRLRLPSLERQVKERRRR